MAPWVPEPLAAGVLAGALAVRHLAQVWITRRKVPGARSGWVTTALLFICYVSAMVLALASVASGRTPVGALVGGGGLWLGAVALRMWALLHLAEQFSSLIEVRSNHRLVDTGPYAVVRHPLHLAFGLEVGALALLAFTPWAVAPGALVWGVLAARNPAEEAALREHFGSAYDDYAARVPAMCIICGVARRLRRRRHKER